jgi:thiol-disulfide isomerase/thioredoxin
MTLADQKQLLFQVYLNLAEAAPSGYFLNGSEQTVIPELYIHGDSLTFVISEYGAAMHALWDGKRYAGQFVRYRKDTASNPFVLTPVSPDETPSPKKPPTEVPLVGKFQVHLKSPEGIDSSLVATFWSRGDSVYGTFIASDGDYGLMAGTQTGNSVQLGRFSGWQGQYMELTRELNHWTGTLYYRVPPALSFELTPRADALVQFPDSKRTSMKDKGKPFVFSGLSVLGDTIRVTDPRFKGKALIVDIMGTWCHNCMDAAPLLQKLYSEFDQDGLEVVALSFEITNDLQLARKNLLLYQERYEIGFSVLFCGSTEKANVDAKLRSQLTNFAAYPTTLFIDRKGIVQYIHEGFVGPGAGEEYQRQVEKYYEMTRRLLGKQSASR